jgi:hypothetical protein
MRLADKCPVCGEETVFDAWTEDGRHYLSCRSLCSKPKQCFDCAYWAGGQTDVPDYRCLHPTRKGLEVDRDDGCQEYREAPKSV